MDVKPRFQASNLTRTERWVYGALTIYFVLACLVTIWPIYPLFGQVRPFVLGLPFNLFYLAVVLVLSFFVLLAVFIWEGRRERNGGGSPGAGRPAPGEPAHRAGAERGGV